MACPRAGADQGGAAGAHAVDAPLARAQLSEALSVISGHDFPARWPELLPELIRRLGSGTPAEVAGVLETANSIYKRYRGAFMSDALSRELAYSQQLVEPLLACLKVRARPGLAATAAAVHHPSKAASVGLVGFLYRVHAK